MYDNDGERYTMCHKLYNLFADCFDPRLRHESDNENEKVCWTNGQTSAYIEREEYKLYKLTIYRNGQMVFEFTSNAQAIGEMIAGIKF